MDLQRAGCFWGSGSSQCSEEANMVGTRPQKCPLAPGFHEPETFLEADGQGPEET